MSRSTSIAPAFKTADRNRSANPNSLSNISRANPAYDTDHVRVVQIGLEGHLLHVSRRTSDAEAYPRYPCKHRFYRRIPFPIRHLSKRINEPSFIVINQSDLPILKRYASANAAERADDLCWSRVTRTWIVFAVLMASVTAALTNVMNLS